MCDGGDFRRFQHFTVKEHHQVYGADALAIIEVNNFTELRKMRAEARKLAAASSYSLINRLHTENEYF